MLKLTPARAQVVWWRRETLLLACGILGACASPIPDLGTVLPAESPAGPTPAAAPVYSLSDALQNQGQGQGEDQHRALWPTLGLNLGGAMLGAFETSIRLDSETLGRGTEVDFEDDLGLDDAAESLRVDAYWRISRHHRLDFSYFDIERTNTRTIARDIQFGDTVFPINTTLTSFFDTEIFKGAYRFTPFPQETWEIGVSLGLHWMHLGVGMAASGLAIAQDFTQEAPLPVAGLHAEWQFLPRLRLRGSTEWFYVHLTGLGSLDEIDGYVTDNVLAIEWDALDFLGVGVGYNYFVFDASVSADALTLAGRYEYSAVLVYARLFL
jgi:hypothetical protein